MGRFQHANDIIGNIYKKLCCVQFFFIKILIFVNRFLRLRMCLLIAIFIWRNKLRQLFSVTKSGVLFKNSLISFSPREQNLQKSLVSNSHTNWHINNALLWKQNYIFIFIME